jgi:hypothetical protein
MGVGRSLRVSEDIGACRRFPLAIAQAANNTWATARASIVFPSDEKDRAAMVLQRSGPSCLRPTSATIQRLVMYGRTNRQQSWQTRFSAVALKSAS